MIQRVVVPCVEDLPPRGVWVQVYLAGFDCIWLRGRLLSADEWEIDTRQEGIPDRVLLSDELITHWTAELPSPQDMRFNSPPIDPEEGEGERRRLE